MRAFQVGDIIKAVSLVTEEDEGQEIILATAGDEGHVIGGPSVDGWPNVWFERTGKVTVCHPDELTLVAGARKGSHGN